MLTLIMGLGLVISVIAIIVVVTLLLLGMFGLINFRIKIQEKPNG